MSKTRDLKEALKSRGFMPGRAELNPLIDRLESDDEEDADLAAQALARHPDVFERVNARFSGATPIGRMRLCRLVGKLASTAENDQLRGFLLVALADEDLRTRRSAVSALGKLEGAEIESALVARWSLEAAPEMRRSLATALGKVGGAAARELLGGVTSDDRELNRIIEEALLRIDRTRGRVERGRVVDDRAPRSPTTVVLRCRRGLEAIVVDQLGARFEPRILGPGRIGAQLAAPLAELWRARSALSFGFPIAAAAAITTAGKTDLQPAGAAVVGAMTSDATLDILSTFTEGAIRYRIEWASAGHRRGLTYRCAAEIARRRPELLNDPTDSLWQLVVTEHSGQIFLELVPRGLPDPRFTYREGAVPAASHPTIAAALAHVARPRADDVVWDPFVGGGTELVEISRLSTTRALYGSDLDEGAVAIARTNLERAGVKATVAWGDARTYVPPEPPTLIVTNPPMGRRVGNRTLTSDLLSATLEHAARTLARGGRLVWISVRADDTAEQAVRLGMRQTESFEVDMAGFWGVVQRFQRVS